MGPASAQLIHELGYDPDDGVPELADVDALDSLVGPQGFERPETSDRIEASEPRATSARSPRRPRSPESPAIAPPGGAGRLADLSRLRDLGALAEGLEPETMIAARVGAQRVAVARLGSGRLVVVVDECPHDGGRISDGFVDGERLVCARHGWELEARNGRCVRACKLRE